MQQSAAQKAMQASWSEEPTKSLRGCLRLAEIQYEGGTCLSSVFARLDIARAKVAARSRQKKPAATGSVSESAGPQYRHKHIAKLGSAVSVTTMRPLSLS